ncbi:hypothetical protein EDD15DRAFT_2409560 [Pisolithus albus]|nr:hypothetical protein EDD15DRAFT_2409560 [Pisolithus albus]
MREHLVVLDPLPLCGASYMLDMVQKWSSDTEIDGSVLAASGVSRKEMRGSGETSAGDKDVTYVTVTMTLGRTGRTFALHNVAVAGERQVLVSLDNYFVVGSEIGRTHEGVRYRRTRSWRIGGTAPWTIFLIGEWRSLTILVMTDHQEADAYPLGVWARRLIRRRNSIPTPTDRFRSADQINALVAHIYEGAFVYQHPFHPSSRAAAHLFRTHFENAGAVCTLTLSLEGFARNVI